VRDGELRAGARLPSEPDLARSLGVSRSSLRAAIAVLEEDGLLRRRQGSGTYVTHKPLLRNDLSRNFSVSAMIAATGMQAGTLLAECASQPVVDTTDWCRSEVLDPVALSELANGSLYDALAARGLSVHQGLATMSPSLAVGELAHRLTVPVGTLLLTLFQVDSTADGVVVVVSREHHLADAFEFGIYRRGPRDGEDET
jgi:GntR family transcriptional regulator